MTMITLAAVVKSVTVRMKELVGGVARLSKGYKL
jgi:hypothetical protein